MRSKNANAIRLIQQLFPAVDGCVVDVAILAMLSFARRHWFKPEHIPKIDVENVDVAHPNTAVVDRYDCLYCVSVMVYHARVFGCEGDCPVGEG